MTLDPRVADLLHKEFEAVRTVRNPALRYALTDLQQGTGAGSALVSKVDTRSAGDYLERAMDYLDRSLRRLTELREPWTEGLRADVESLLHRELEQDWTWLVNLRDEKLTPRLKDQGQGQLTTAKTAAFARIEVELGFCVLREEKRRLPVAELLTAPRYAAVRRSWEQANQYADRSPPADEEAAREAMLALEALAKLVIDDDSATLGRAINVMRSSADAAGRHLLPSIEKIWSFTNTAPHVRHGGGSGDPITTPEAQYVVGVTREAIRLLLVFDLGDHSTNSTADGTEETSEAAKSL